MLFRSVSVHAVALRDAGRAQDPDQKGRRPDAVSGHELRGSASLSVVLFRSRAVFLVFLERVREKEREIKREERECVCIADAARGPGKKRGSSYEIGRGARREKVWGPRVPAPKKKKGGEKEKVKGADLFKSDETDKDTRSGYTAIKVCLFSTWSNHLRDLTVDCN